MIRSVGIIIFIVFLINFSGNAQETDSFANSDEFSTTVSNETITAQQCNGCTKCESDSSKLTLPFNEFPFIVVVLTVFVLLVIKKNRKRVLFWTLGLTFFAALVAFVVQNQRTPENKKRIVEVDLKSSDPLPVNANDSIVVPEIAELSDFNNSDKFEEFSATGDEFNDFNEFEEFTEADEFNGLADGNTFLDEQEKSTIFRILLALFITILSGFAFRNPNFRTLRFGILLASLVYLGFYSSGCPCMISSFQHFVLFLLGEKTQWTSLIWFLGLIPVTYFFGKIWCGWVCHLGALQEFIYRPQKKNKLLNPTIQKGFKILQLTALFVLLVQLIVTRTNLFIKIDPFKVAFNLFSPKLTGYILLVILLVSSLFIYRPFCKGFCPVGLVLGWIESIPGASKLSISSECKSCNLCLKGCSYSAINKKDWQFKIVNSECIRCGECLDSCKSGMIR